MASAAVTMSSSSSSSSPTPRNTVLVSRWKCDFCPKLFESMEEATTHEECCRLSQSFNSTSASNSTTATTINPIASAAATATEKSKKKSTKSAKLPFLPKKRFAHSALSLSDDDDDDDQVVTFVPQPAKITPTTGKKSKAKVDNGAKNSRQQKLLKLSSSDRKPIKSSSLEQTAAPKTTNKSKKRRAPSEQRSSSPEVTVVDASPKDTKATRKSLKATKKDSSSESQQQQQQQHAMFLGMSHKQLLAEQRQAEFQAQRRRTAERHRQRQQQRREWKGSSNSNSNPKLSSNNSAKSSCTNTSNSPTTSKQSPFIPFPVPNHVIPSSTTLDNVTTIPAADYSWIPASDIAKTASSAHVNVIDTEDKQEDSYEFHKDKVTHTHVDLSYDPMHAILSSGLFIPDPSCTESTLSTNAKLPNIPYGGASFQAAHSQLSNFIQEWKVERQRAHERRADNHQKYVKLNTTKNSTETNKRKAAAIRRYSNDDDELWTDDECEDEILSPMFGLTGPVGAGKTALVHTVAALHGCPVREINTCERRSAAHLKRQREATQSHSSRELLRPATLVSAVSAANEEAESNDDMEQQQGAALTIILIDEVDLLFEDDGGFWNALGELRKVAKCPIVLTANRDDFAQTNSTPQQYELCRLERPSPDECVSLIQDCARDQGLCVNPSWSKKYTNDALTDLATLVRGDLRRLQWGLQVLAISSANGVSLSRSPGVPTIEMLPSPTGTESPTSPRTSQYHRPVIESVTPPNIPSHVPSLITISGGHFKAACSDTVVVNIGNRACPFARIMDDCTILAVAPPLWLQQNIKGDHHSILHGTERSLDSCLASVVVVVHREDGRQFSSSHNVATVSNSDASSGEAAVDSISELQNACLIQYSATNATTGAEAMDDECEFDDEAGRKSTSSTTLLTRSPPDLASIVVQQAEEIFMDGIKAWHSRNKEETAEMAQSTTITGNQIADSSEFTKLVQQAENQSCSGLFDEYACVPLMSGACSGFGFDLTEAFPKCTNDNSKRPSEEQLLASGWKDMSGFYGNTDSFVTSPLGESRLLSRTQTATRSYGFLFETQAVTAATQENPDAEEDTDQVSMFMEEDYLLPNPTEEQIRASASHLHFPQVNAHHYCRSEAYASKMVSALQNTLFADSFGHRSFLRGLVRILDGLVDPRDRLDSRLVLDYLPALRLICYYEVVSEKRFKAVLNPEVAAEMSHHKRTTRRSKKLGRTHYLEGLIPDYLLRDDGNKVDCSRLASLLATDRLK